MKANFRDPGDEVKEDLKSGMDAAIAGGFTEVVLMPSTLPPVQSKADVGVFVGPLQGDLVTIDPTRTLIR